MLVADVDVRLLEQTILNVCVVLCVEHPLLLLLDATVFLVEVPSLRVTLLRLEMNIEVRSTVLHAGAQLNIVQRYVAQLATYLALLVEVLVANDTVLEMYQACSHNVSVHISVYRLPFLEVALCLECQFFLHSILAGTLKMTLVELSACSTLFQRDPASPWHGHVALELQLLLKEIVFIGAVVLRRLLQVDVVR